MSMEYISQTYLYNFDPLKPNFSIVILGFTGVYNIFLFLLKNIDCGYSLEPPRRGGRMRTRNLCFEQKYEKYLNLYLKTSSFILEQACFRNEHWPKITFKEY